MAADKRSAHGVYRELVDAIETQCPVAEWRTDDIDLWPLASQDLFCDVFGQTGGDTAPVPPSFAIRVASTIATPAMNLWKSRRDVAHWVAKPHRAEAILLGDGVSLDRVDGSWRDRFGEPIIAALERLGRTCFVMQSGNLARLPWARPTYAANLIAARAAIDAALARRAAPNLPGHASVMRLIEQAGVEAPSLAPAWLARRARVVAAQAAAFDRVLRRVRPSVAFVVTYYMGLGHAFALACRRRGILCVDLQHCSHDGTHRAYRWPTLPPHGYSTLPGLFWTWTEEDSANIRRWTDGLGGRWHRAIAGGHPQISALRDSDADRLWQSALAATNGDRSYKREILVALQPIGGKRHIWEALAHAIETAPSSWRWWIRRHPASTPEQDRAYGRLLSLDRTNVVLGEGAQIPLPALLGHMDALVSLASGAAGEAAMYDVPAFFLDVEAKETFPGLIARGEATMIDVGSLISAISRLPRERPASAVQMSSIEDTLAKIDRIAEDYAGLCRESAHEEADRGPRIIREREPPRAIGHESLNRLA